LARFGLKERIVLNGIAISKRLRRSWLSGPAGLLLAAVACGNCRGQVTLPNFSPQTTQAAAGGGGDYAVTRVGPHSRVWQNSTGQSVMEIATGMNYFNGQQWTPSVNSFVISPDGTAFVANQIQDPTRLAANLDSVGAVTVTTPDNVTLSSTPIAIGLFDAASGMSVVLAAITNTTGALADPQHVVYNQAFVGGGISASVVYSLPDTGSFHQDVVFTGFDPGFDPTALGFPANSASTLQVQIFTEFYDPPQPQAFERPLYIEQDPAVRARMAAPDFIDYMFDFGHYVLGPGRFYTTATNSLSAPGVPVAKSFTTTSAGRTFLVESFSYASALSYLKSLPPPQLRTSLLKGLPRARKMKVAAASLPSLKELKKVSTERIVPGKGASLASATPRGLTADYIATVGSASEPTLYASDTTYFVAGTVYLTGPVTIESAVFKFPTNYIGAIMIEDTLTLATTNYRPAIFTAADDNTAGATLSTSIWSNYSGTIGANYYGDIALWLSTSANNISMHDLRFRYLFIPIGIGADVANQSMSLSDSVFLGCAYGVYIGGGNVGGIGSCSLALNANNCLMSCDEYAFEAQTIVVTANAFNWTVDGCPNLALVDSYSSGTFSLTNSIFSSMTSTGTLAGITLKGGNNGFYSSPTFGTAPLVAPNNPYQPTWAGFYYLTNNTPFLTNGTTNIGAAQLSQLQVKTTQPPFSLLPAPQFTVDTVLSPVAQRDTTGLAIGFHYDPIDYWGACSVSNATLYLSNGVVLAYYDGCLVWLQDNAHLVSQGTPNQRNYIVYFSAAQEWPYLYWGSTIAQLYPICPNPSGASAMPSVFLRLTTICAPTGETNLWNTGDFGLGQNISSLTLQDCEVYGSGATWLMNENANTPAVGFTNTVFHRVPMAINSNAKIGSFNNLFYGTTNTNAPLISIQYRNGAPSPNTNENNVFDGVTASLDGVVGYNAYLNGATNISYTNNNDIWTNMAWIGGPLGGYYQATNSPLLTNGSTLAANLGLYHYTVLTNEAVEGTNIVSRGYHYVALGANGLPLDTNGDGIPDYLEDANGNGVVDSGEIDWLVAGDLGLTVIIMQPANNSLIP
jgi:hypothetical protein